MKGSRRIGRAAAPLAAVLVAAPLAVTAFADQAVVERISAGPEGGNAEKPAWAAARSADG